MPESAKSKLIREDISPRIQSMECETSKFEEPGMGLVFSCPQAGFNKKTNRNAQIKYAGLGFLFIYT